MVICGRLPDHLDIFDSGLSNAGTSWETWSELVLYKTPTRTSVKAAMGLWHWTSLQSPPVHRADAHQLDLSMYPKSSRILGIPVYHTFPRERITFTHYSTKVLQTALYHLLTCLQRMNDHKTVPLRSWPTITMISQFKHCPYVWTVVPLTKSGLD